MRGRGLLVVVDVRQGFINPETAHVPPRIRRLIERGEHEIVLFTRSVNVPEGPYQRFLT